MYDGVNDGDRLDMSLDTQYWYLLGPDEQIEHGYSFFDDVFTPDECLLWSKLIEESHELEEAITKDTNYTAKVRKSQVAWVKMNEEMAPLYKKLVDATIIANQQFYNFNLSAIETLQYTVYDSKISKQSRYDWHQDEGFNIKTDNVIRKLSFVLLLTEPKDFTGGELQVQNSEKPTPVHELKQGTIVFFPSPTLHRVTKVTGGVRKTLVGWASGPHWT